MNEILYSGSKFVRAGVQSVSEDSDPAGTGSAGASGLGNGFSLLMSGKNVGEGVSHWSRSPLTVKKILL